MDLSELDLDAANAAIAAATEVGELADLRKRLVGKGSAAFRIRESIKTLDPADRPVVGKAVTEFTKAVEAAVELRTAELGPANRPSPTTSPMCAL